MESMKRQIVVECHDHLQADINWNMTNYESILVQPDIQLKIILLSL